MFKVKVTYESGYSDIGECATQADAQEAVAGAALRQFAGQDGITEVLAWEV